MTRDKTATSAKISEILLPWYDRNAREMPWRVAPAARQAGVMPDPYHVWLSEVMLQQTTVATVGPYFRAFLSRWPSVHDLASAPDAEVLGEWAGLGYYARARNLLKCARHVSTELGGEFPQDEAGLLLLPGIGPYTAAAISAIAYDHSVTVLDGNIERVMARFFKVVQPLPMCKPALRELAGKATPLARTGDYVQAVMDLGATICTPRSPKCAVCPLAALCAANAAGVAHTLPIKRPKGPKPTRYGIVYFAYDSLGLVLMETRAESGLLGGMLALPSTKWAETAPRGAVPVNANWQELPEQVRHVFTHFNLILTIQIAKSSDKSPNRGAWISRPDPQTLPSVMRKAYTIALNSAGISSKSPDK